jgi:ribosome recycling factor
MAQSKPFDLEDLNKRMRGAVHTLKQEFSGLRTGRASVSLLEPVQVDAYGSNMPITQVGTVNAPEPRMLTVQVWDRGLVIAVDKAIRGAGLGLNPQVDGQLLRIPIPPLTEDRRKELSKIAAKYSESARIAVRNIRRDGMEHLKKLEKEHQMSEDEHKKMSEKVQQATDSHIKEIDEAYTSKEKEIMQV